LGICEEKFFNFPRLYPESPDLNLIIIPAGKFDVTVGQETCKISSPIKAGSGSMTKRVRDEALSA
jgi:hypothetical protein